MKKLLLCLCAASLALLSGCASTRADFTYVPDVAKMQAVQTAADRYGTQVVWVNTPMKKVPLSGT